MESQDEFYSNKIETTLHQMLDYFRCLEKDTPGEGLKALNEFYADKQLNMSKEIYDGLKLGIEDLTADIIFQVKKVGTINNKPTN